MPVLEEEKKGLARHLGLWETLSIGVGSTIGGSIFIILGDAAGLAGPAVVLAFALGALATLLMALNYSELAVSLPVSGGGYVFTREAVGGLASFTTGWFLWIGNMLYAAMNALGFALIVSLYVPWLDPVLVAEAVLALFCYLNVRGIRETGRVQLFLTALLVAGLVGFSLASLTSWDPSALTRPSFMPKGIRGVLAATGFAFVAYWGFESIATVGGEVREPEKVIPAACLLAVLASGAIYVLVSLASIGLVGWELLAESETPLVLVGRALLGPAGELLMSLLGAIATLTSLNAALLSAARISYALARDGLLPGVFGVVHEKFRTPHRAVMLSAFISGLFALSGLVWFLAGAASFGFLMGLLAVNLSIIFLRRKRRYLPREFKVPAYPLTPILAVAICLSLLAFMSHIVLALGVAVAVIGTLVFLFDLATPRTRESAIGGFSFASSLAVLFLLYLTDIIICLPAPRASLKTLFYAGAAVQMAASLICAVPLGEIFLHVARPLGAVEEPGVSMPGRAVRAVKAVEVAMGIAQLVLAGLAAFSIYGAVGGFVAFPGIPALYYWPGTAIACITLAFFSLANTVCGFTLMRRRYVPPIS